MNTLKPSSSLPALVVFISIPLFFGIGQEIVVFPGLHDDYYFIHRALSLKMNGNYLAPIKELLYPLFIRVSWLYGLGLRNFEVICYGISLFYLWKQITALTNRHLVGWLTVLPLTLFSSQHTVFNHATYDALQLILLPLCFATAINLYIKKANRSSLLLAGITVGLLILNRPEGILFLLPPLTALAALWVTEKHDKHFFRSLLPLIPRAMLLLILALLSQQIACAVNWQNFGFWAPTLIKADNFQRCLKNLMAIKPADDLRLHYITVPKTSLEKAYQISPSLRKAKPLLDQQLDGYGWSGFAPYQYRAIDGSVSGGHFQWALLDTAWYVVGSDIKAMLVYFGTVADELDAGFASGTIQRRNVLTTALGPEFSFFDRGFWQSLVKISQLTFNFGPPDLPSISVTGHYPVIDSLFDIVTLRRTGFLDSIQWQVTGWVIHPDKGIPDSISLDQTALKNDITLKVMERPGVLKAMPDIQHNSSKPAMCGIFIKSPGPVDGNLQMFYDDQTVLLPLKDLRMLESGQFLDLPGIHLQVDYSFITPAHWVVPFTTLITKIIFYTFRGIICTAFIFSASIFILRKSKTLQAVDLSPIFFLTALTASVIIPRLLLFAAIDSNMYLGTEVRYMAPGLFAVWLYAAFTVSYLLTQLIWIRHIKDNEIT